MIEIKEVKSRRDIRKFATYPVKLYKNCPYYVPSVRGDEMATFNPKKNFNLAGNKAKGFLAYKDGKLVGRIAGLINYKHNQLSGKNYVRFSRFECIDDIEVFKALLGAVEDFGRQNGMDIMHGPWGFNDTDREGMLTYGFDLRSTYSTNYYYPYFCENMKKLGFSDESKWLERNFKIPEKVDERLTSIAEKVKKKLKVVDVAETMSIKEILKKYGDKLFDTLNESYAHLDGYAPIEGKSRDNVLSQFATICNIDYISFLVDEDGECAAFGVVLPSICEPLVKHRGRLFPFGFIGVLKAIKRPKELEMALIGVKNKYKNTGINAAVIVRIIGNIIKNKIQRIESNVMLENNYNIQNQWKFAESEIIKKRQTYQKEITK